MSPLTSIFFKVLSRNETVNIGKNWKCDIKICVSSIDINATGIAVLLWFVAYFIMKRNAKFQF